MPDPLSLNRPAGMPEQATGMTHLVPQRRLARLLAFSGRSIDDVVNSGVAKREVLHYFKVDKAVSRRLEVVDLERQWNPLGRSV